MTQFHTDDYIEFLEKITPESMHLFPEEQSKYNVGGDSPIFDGLFDFCGISAGGSMEGAGHLSRGKCDIAINWAGGLHHAKKSEASGFCYVNGTSSLRVEKIVAYLYFVRHRISDLGAIANLSKSFVHRYRCSSWRWRRRGILDN